MVPFNERGEVVVGNMSDIFAAKVEAEEFIDYPTKKIIERPDGALVRVMKLEYRGQLFGAVLVGPFVFEEGKVENLVCMSKKI